jgi:hypothetical protein
MDGTAAHKFNEISQTQKDIFSFIGGIQTFFLRK